MNSKILHAVRLQLPIGIKKLLLRHAILGISGIVHDSVAHPEYAARIVAAAHGLREGISEKLLQRCNVRNVIQIDDGTELSCKHILTVRRLVRGKHDFVSRSPDGIRQYKLCLRRAVKAKTVILHNLHQIGVGRCFHGKIFAKARIP